MFYNTTFLSEPGGWINEDAVGNGLSFMFVIDGASGLSKKRIMDDESDAKWFSHSTARLLEERLPDSKASIAMIVNGIMADLAALWRGDPIDYPSASIAIWRENGGKLEYFGLADCDASLMLKTGEVLSWSETQVAKLDNYALSWMTEYRREHGCSMAEAREACSDILIHNRKLKNTADGYWVLDPSCTGISHARTFEIPIYKCESVFACSDGFSQLIGFNEVRNLEQLHRAVKTNGLPYMKSRLYSLQEDDREMTMLPRFKFRDDTSAIFSYLEG